MKKAVVMLLTTSMLIGLCACGQTTDTSTSLETDTTTPTTNVIMEVPDTGNEKDKEIIDTVPDPIVEETEPVASQNATFLDTSDTTTSDNGETITAASLIDSLKDKNIQYVKGNCKFVIDISDSTSSLNVILNMDIESNKKWAHANTTTTMSGQSIAVETWMSSETGQCYSSVQGYSGWQATQADNFTDYTNLNSNLTSEACTQLEFSQITDEYYEVSATIPANVAAELVGANNVNPHPVDLSGITYNAIYRFDKETKELQYVRINIIMSDAEQRKQGIEINQYYIEFNYEEISTEVKELTPPSFN